MPDLFRAPATETFSQFRTSNDITIHITLSITSFGYFLLVLTAGHAWLMRRSSTRRRGRGSHMILICIHNYHNYHEIYIFIELAFHTPPFRGPAYQKPYVPVPVAAPAPHLTSKKAPLCVSPRERMPGYGATAVDKKLGLVCPHCKLLLRSAVQTDKGVRLCESCFKEIAR